MYDFLSYREWINAARLLNAQTELMETNKHFKTLDMLYYDEIKDGYDGLSSKDFFHTYIKTGAFYGVEGLTAFGEYPRPKKGFALRNYKILCLPLRLIHYAICLYLEKISRQFRSDIYKTEQRLSGYYGGSIKYSDDGEIITDQNKLYYRPFYRKYREEVLELNSDRDPNVRVIKLDVRDFFDSINLKILLQSLNRVIRFDKKEEHKFDEGALYAINEFYKFLSGDRRGIPQLGNNICSGFIGYLFFCLIDLDIADCLVETIGVKEWEIVRYVDDIYICIRLDDSNSVAGIDAITRDLGHRISELLYRDYELRLNRKCAIYNRSREKGEEHFRESLKAISANIKTGEFIEDVRNTPFSELLDRIITECRSINGKAGSAELGLEDAESLKIVYELEQRGFLDSNEASEKLSQLFDKEFAYEVVQIDPVPFLLLLLASEDGIDHFRNYLLTSGLDSVNQDLVALEYLIQKYPSIDNEVVASISLDPPFLSDAFNCIFSEKERGDLNYRQLYGLEQKHSESLYSVVSGSDRLENLIRQIKGRVFAIERRYYGVALNHLVNEVQIICYAFNTRHSDEDIGELSQYNQLDVLRFMAKADCTFSSRVAIRCLYARRNHNVISHPTQVAGRRSLVAEDEYQNYYDSVVTCIGELSVCVEL